MKWLNLIGARERGFFRREAVLQDIEEEMRIHVDMETHANIERGMPLDEARSCRSQDIWQPGPNQAIGLRDPRGRMRAVSIETNRLGKNR